MLIMDISDKINYITPFSMKNETLFNEKNIWL